MMRQFDVCRNTARAKEGFPNRLIVQCRECDAAHRLVVPLTLSTRW